MGGALLSLTLAATALAVQESAPPALELRNGRWFDGQGFVERTLFAVDGVFASECPPESMGVIEVRDLAGGYVVPPFAEAHNHNVHDGADAALRRYLEQGVFYVKNPNSLPRTTTSIRAQVNRADGVDVVFAGGGLTSSGGHPVDIVEPQVARGAWIAADGDGGFYFAIDDADDLARTWPAIRAQPRDFLKTYLLYSEDYERLRADDAARGWRGLDPALLPEIVRRAHEAGWRVSTHVESAADLRNALAAGVNEVNHLPGFRPLVPAVAAAIGAPPSLRFPLASYALSDDDARRAAAQGIVVVTTVGALVRALEAVPDDAPEREDADAVFELVRANLDVLHRHGARLAIGSDEYDFQQVTVVDEYLALARLDVFEPAELLALWCRDTPRAIFPDRQIGALEPGAEASFLVLGGDPLADPERVRDVRLRVKQGREIDVSRR